MKRVDWRCTTCRECSTGEICEHCGEPRFPEEQRSSKFGKVGTDEPATKGDRIVVGPNGVWPCQMCKADVIDEKTECTTCGAMRWLGCENFDGRGFFVNRTPMDEALDCSSMRRLHWQQLLRPPSAKEKLLALFVSGMVDDEDEGELFAKTFFPRDVAAWMVAQDCSDPGKTEENKYRVLAGSDAQTMREIDGCERGVKWNAVFFKPKTGLMHIKVCFVCFVSFLNLFLVAKALSFPFLLDASFDGLLSESNVHVVVLSARKHVGARLSNLC
jgi:hypothetical protein